MTDDEELQARIGEEIDVDSLIALGAEHGCEFTADDLTAGAELSDEELDGVAGGAVYIKFDGIGRSGGKFRMKLGAKGTGVRPQNGIVILDQD